MSLSQRSRGLLLPIKITSGPFGDQRAPVLPSDLRALVALKASWTALLASLASYLGAYGVSKLVSTHPAETGQQTPGLQCTWAINSILSPHTLFDQPPDSPSLGPQCPRRVTW